jgi:hypothetical protein
MCNPALFQTFGTGLQASGVLQQGNEAASAANYNASVADAQSRDALDRGTVAESRYAREVKQVEGSQKAAFGASNVTRSGTALDLLGDTAMIASEDAQTIRQNASREAAGYTSQAAELRRQGRAARGAGQLGFGATLLTGGSRAYGLWKGAQSA